MGQSQSTPPPPAVVNVGLPGAPSSWSAQDSQDDNKTHVVSEAGGMMMSGFSRLQHNSTRIITTPGGRASAGGAGEAPDGGWVDASVSTPLFPHGRPNGVERQARHQKRVSKFRVFADGVVFEGPEAMAIGDTHDLCRGYERLVGRPVTRVTVGDKRAQQVLVAWADGKFYAVPSRQSFSRHLGVCLILGDKTARGPRHSLKVGDILRLGSVGLLVSEVCPGSDAGAAQVVSQDVLDQIREEIQTAPRQVLAPLRKEFEGALAAEEHEKETAASASAGAKEEEGLGKDGAAGGARRHEEDEEDLLSEADAEDDGTEHSVSSVGSAQEPAGARAGPAGAGAALGGVAAEEDASKYQCYICMDSEEEEGDVLIAPCQCKGSTALVHVKCLQRLLSTGDAKKTSVISTKHQNHTCKICKARYKTHVKLPDGTLLPLLNPSLVPPYITLVVITRHESHPDLFNTIFQLSFARNAELSLGRSQGCDVVIGYRTVSTRHATISYSRGEFHYQDARSSNGSLLYLRGPLEIPTSRPIRLRMGRSILSLRARQSLQLASLPRRAAADAWRWLSSSLGGGGEGHRSGAGGHGGGGRGNEERRSGSGTVSPGGHQTGLELLRDLHMGRFQQPDDEFGSSLYLGGDSSLVSRSDIAGVGGGGPGRCLRTEASGEGRGLLFHMESSSSSLVDSGGASGSGGGGQRRRGGGSGSGGERPNREWSIRENVLHLAPAGAAAGGGSSGDGESKSSSGGGSSSGARGAEDGAGAGAGAGGEKDGDGDEEEVPPFQPSLAHSDLVSAPSTRAVLQRTRSSRV